MKKVLLVFLLMFSSPSFATGISGVSAPCDNATLSKYTGTADIEINWEPNTIGLNWYDGDTKLTVANSAQSCVYDSTLTVPPQPTKPGYTFNGWKVIHVPGGFTELQYIEATGTQYIDTGFSPDANTRVDYKVRLVTGVNNGGPIIGARLGSNSSNRFFPLANGFDSNTYRTVFSNREYSFTINFDIYYEGSFQPANGVSIINGTTRDISNSNFNKIENNNLYLFATSGYTESLYNSKGQMYYVTVYDRGVMVRNMIPAKRNSDNVVGMYDTVTDTFFTNAGSGTFVAGPAVQ